MSGKVWTLITIVMFITDIHYVHSKCMERDFKTHFHNELLEDHIFEIKVFSSETKEHKLLSVINTLCKNWMKEKQVKKTLMVIQTFKYMLSSLDKNITAFCQTHNCTEGYTISYVNKTMFGDMYLNSCSGSVSDLKCPSESTTSLTTVNPEGTAYEGTTFLTATTDSTTSLTSPNITSPENVSTVSSAPINSSQTQNVTQNLSNIVIPIVSTLLALSVLLNLILIRMKQKERPNGESTSD